MNANDETQNTKKAKPKNQPKIHRRKNEQIPKQFECPVQSCGKAYGSYAALYTHMKNKHNEIKPPNMLATSSSKPKNHPGRPKVKKNQNSIIEELQNEINEQNQISNIHNNLQQDIVAVICKICISDPCECVDDFSIQQKNKTIEIMSNQKFTNFINEIGELSKQIEESSWVRRTQDEYLFKSVQSILEESKQFSSKFNIQVNLSEKLLQYLSFSSKYWDKQNINQLYNVIYAMIAFQNHQACVKFVNQNQQFAKMQACIKQNPNEFKRLESIVRVI